MVVAAAFTTCRCQPPLGDGLSQGKETGKRRKTAVVAAAAGYGSVDAQQLFARLPSRSFSSALSFSFRFGTQEG